MRLVDDVKFPDRRRAKADELDKKPSRVVVGSEEILAPRAEGDDIVDEPDGSTSNRDIDRRRIRRPGRLEQHAAAGGTGVVFREFVEEQCDLSVG